MRRLAALASLWLAACSDPASEAGTTGADPATTGGGGAAASTGTTQGAGAAGGGGEGAGGRAPQSVTYGVGYALRSVTYDPNGDDPGRKLEHVALWYPTEDAAGTATSYRFGIERPDVWTDATPIAATALPVLLFSHGHLAFAEQSYFLCEHFASRGWLVAAPDHTGNTYKNVVGGNPDARAFLDRPQDLSAVLDHLEGLPASDPLAGKAGDAVVVAGHSFGGFTTWMLAGASIDFVHWDAGCASGEFPKFQCPSMSADERAVAAAGFLDRRVDLALPMAAAGGYQLGPNGTGTVAMPVFMMTAAGDTVLPNAVHGDPMWAALDEPHHRRADFTTGNHGTFTNACDLTLPPPGWCSGAAIDVAVAHPILLAYAHAFARRHLWGDESEAALLDGKISSSPEVVLSLP
jgi:predicted dienelactone hydrolase